MNTVTETPKTVPTDLKESFTPLLAPEIQKSYAAPVVDLVKDNGGECILVRHLPRSLAAADVEESQFKEICHELKESYIAGKFTKRSGFRMCISYTFSLRKETSGQQTLAINFLPTIESARALSKLSRANLTKTQYQQLKHSGKIIASDDDYIIINERSMTADEIKQQVTNFANECYTKIRDLVSTSVETALDTVFKSDNIYTALSEILGVDRINIIAAIINGNNVAV